LLGLEVRFLNGNGFIDVKDVLFSWRRGIVKLSLESFTDFTLGDKRTRMGKSDRVEKVLTSDTAETYGGCLKEGICEEFRQHQG